MASVLTPNAPNPLTNLVHPYVGTHFVGSNALEVFTFVTTVVQRGGWWWSIHPDSINPALQVIDLFHSLTAPPQGAAPDLIVRDTQWLAFDGKFCLGLDQTDVDNNYTVTAQA